MECVLALNFGAICALQSNLPISQIGSTVFIVSPLTTIEDQLLQDCERMGIPAVAGSKACFLLIFYHFPINKHETIEYRLPLMTLVEKWLKNIWNVIMLTRYSPFLYFMSSSSSTASSMWSVETWGVRETKTQVSRSQYCVRP